MQGDIHRLLPGACRGHFNPLSPCGEIRDMAAAAYMPCRYQYFNPLSPCGEIHDIDRIIFWIPVYFNPFSPGGEIREARDREMIAIFQSTLPGRGDTKRPKAGLIEWNFNPLSLCGEIPFTVRDPTRRGKFQSTLPIRGDTYTF